MTNSIDLSARNSQREIEALAASHAEQAQANKSEANKTPLRPTWTQEPMQSRAPTFSAAALRSEPAEEKVNAAREGINSVALELSGHGVDINRLAQQFSSSRYAGTPNSSVQSLARQAFIAEALKAHPELTDKINTMLMRGLPESMRSTVLAGVSQPTSGTPSPAEGIQRVKEQGVEAKRVMDAVNAENRKITTVSRNAEVFTGLAHASTTVSGLIAGAVTGRMRKAMETAEHSGAFVAGELTQKQAQVRQAYGACIRTYGRYTEANAQYQQALASHDYQSIPGLARRCQELGGELKTDAARFAERSQEAQRMEGHFDEATVGVVAHALLMAGSLGASSVVASAIGHQAELVSEVEVVGPIQSLLAESISHRALAGRKKH